MEFIQCPDGSRVNVNRWAPADNRANGALLIAHGMGEYGERYAPFAKQLTEKGLAVYAPDHRGHGRTAEACGGPQGHLADENGWELIVDDLRLVVERIRTDYPGRPIFLFGHSMGSLLARRFTQKYGTEIDGVIHSAASGPMGLAAGFGLLLAELEIKLIGKRTASKRMGRLLFGGFNRAFRPSRTPYDWISRDEREVDRYIADDRILKLFSAGLFRDMIGGVIALNKEKNMRCTPLDLPILFISGGRDPLGGFTKGVRQTFNLYLKLGCKDVSLKIYPDARHELLQEVNRDEVARDVWEWISARMQKRA